MGYKHLTQYDAKLSGGRTSPFLLEGAPTSGVAGTMAGRAGLGSQLIDIVNAKYYICTAYNSGTNNITWTVVGTQT